MNKPFVTVMPKGNGLWSHKNSLPVLWKNRWNSVKKFNWCGKRNFCLDSSGKYFVNMSEGKNYEKSNVHLITKKGFQICINVFESPNCNDDVLIFPEIILAFKLLIILICLRNWQQILLTWVSNSFYIPLMRSEWHLMTWFSMFVFILLFNMKRKVAIKLFVHKQKL